MSGSLKFSDGLVQDCGNSSALAMELLQSCTKTSIYLCSLLVRVTIKLLDIELNRWADARAVYMGQVKFVQPF